MENQITLANEEKKTIELGLYELRRIYLENVDYILKDGERDKANRQIYINIAKRNKELSREAAKLSEKVWKL